MLQALAPLFSVLSDWGIKLAQRLFVLRIRSVPTQVRTAQSRAASYRSTPVPAYVSWTHAPTCPLLPVLPIG